MNLTYPVKAFYIYGDIFDRLYKKNIERIGRRFSISIPLFFCGGEDYLIFECDHTAYIFDGTKCGCVAKGSERGKKRVWKAPGYSDLSKLLTLNHFKQRRFSFLNSAKVRRNFTASE